MLLAVCVCCRGGGVAARAEDDGWRAISIEVNEVAGVYQWSVNWDISFHYTKFDKVFPDGSGVFVSRQIHKGARLPDKPLVTRQSPGIDEVAHGANVSMAAMPPSQRLTGCGGELYRENDGETAHQRDWDALVAARDRIFRENGVNASTPLREKVTIIADWARRPHGDGPVYESKHPVDVTFHNTFCVGKSNLFTAIVHTMGIPARTVNMNGHSVAEVLLDGRWYYVENISTASTDSRSTAALCPCSLMEFYADPEAYREQTSESHIASDYYRSPDLHNGRANWQLGALWRWHFIQCGNGDDMIMRNTMRNGSGIAVTLNSATSAALYPNADAHYYKVLKSAPPIMTNYQKHSWYRAGHRVLQGDWIRKRFYIGNLDDPDNPVTKVISRLYLMGGDTQTFAIPPVYAKEYAEWTLKINGKARALKDFKGWKLVREFEPVAMMPIIYFEFELDEKDLKQNDYNILGFGGKPCEQYHEQHIHVMIFPDPLEPYCHPYKPGKGSRVQKEWRIITDQKWDWLQIVEYAH